MIKKTICLILALTALLPAACGCRTAPPERTLTFETINKHGNVILHTTFEEMKKAGIEVGDLITVRVGGASYTMPVGTAYTDVDSGDMICRFDLEDDDVILAINYGSFAAAAGIAEKQTIEEDPGYRWDVRVAEVTVQLKEKGGYLAEYRARNLTRTDARADYAALSDEEFANFRAVTVKGIGEGVLYRSSTPVEEAIGRNEYAMAAMEKAGVRTVVNLDDSRQTMLDYAAYPGSYYSRCRIVNPEMSYDFTSAEFGEKVRTCLLFIAENDGPYLVHCKEGKDRTGILCAILEGFAGADADEIAADYMLTYRNYYALEPSDAAYAIILNNNLVKTLSALLGLDDLRAADLQEKTAQYLRSIGLTDAQLALLRERLGGK